MSHVILNNKARNREWAPSTRAKKQSRNLLLLFIEVAAVIGLLVAAFQLWQTQQTLQQDLRTAQEIQAIIQDDAGQSGAAAHEREQDSAGAIDEQRTFSSPDGQGSQVGPFFWGVAPEIGAGDG